jgi:hypothetical protein
MQNAIEQPQLDFTQAAPMPSAAHEDAPGEAGDTFNVGQAVFLKGAQYCGQPGRVLRIERGKLAILWADLGPSYIGRHSPDSLMLAEDSPGGSETVPPTNTGLPATLAALLEQVDEGGL